MKILLTSLFIVGSALASEGIYLGKSDQGDVYRFDGKDQNCIKVLNNSQKVIKSICAPNTDDPNFYPMQMTNPQVIRDEEKSHGGGVITYLGSRELVNSGTIDQQDIFHEYPIVQADDETTCARVIAAKSVRSDMEESLGNYFSYVLLNPIEGIKTFARGDDRFFRRVKSICWKAE